MTHKCGFSAGATRTALLAFAALLKHANEIEKTEVTQSDAFFGDLVREKRAAHLPAQAGN